MATNDKLWQLMATFGNFWRLLATLCNFLQPFTFFCNFLQLFATFGNFLQLLATFGTFLQFFAIMSSFVIFWLTSPSPSGDDVIYEQPLSKYTVFHQIHNINALLSQNVFVSIYALFPHNFSVSKSISPPICSLFGCTAVRQWQADVRKTFSPETFRPEKNAKN